MTGSVSFPRIDIVIKFKLPSCQKNVHFPCVSIHPHIYFHLFLKSGSHSRITHCIYGCHVSLVFFNLEPISAPFFSPMTSAVLKVPGFSCDALQCGFIYFFMIESGWTSWERMLHKRCVLPVAGAHRVAWDTGDAKPDHLVNVLSVGPLATSVPRVAHLDPARSIFLHLFFF